MSATFLGGPTDSMGRCPANALSTVVQPTRDGKMGALGSTRRELLFAQDAKSASWLSRAAAIVSICVISITDEC